MIVADQVRAVLTRPRMEPDEARAILQGHWAIDGELHRLPSERDRNFEVRVDGQTRYVLKLSNAAEEAGSLDFQHQAMARLAEAGVPCQAPVPALDGRDIVDVGRDGTPTLARLLTWLPGRPLATFPPGDRPFGLFHDLGRVMGRTATALVRFDHAAAHRAFQWDADRGLAIIEAHAPAIEKANRVALLGAWVGRLGPLDAALPELRHSVIHNDANDHNVLVSDDGRWVTGLLDFGDAIHSVLASELAVTAAYAALDAPDPLAVIAAVRRGFEELCPLRDDESTWLVELVALRLATSVALSAHQSRLDPDDAYLTVSEQPAWALLERLIAIEPAAAAAVVMARGS